MSKRYIIADKAVECPHCGRADFEARKILLNTRGATFLNFDWLNRTAVTLKCQNCGRLEWFDAEPREARPPLATTRAEIR
jgi:predicted nucleic-acid-binding Zn-ribbon protein